MECSHALWFVGCSAGHVLLGAWKTRGICREGGVCEQAVLSLANVASENSRYLNVEPSHLIPHKIKLFNLSIGLCSMGLWFSAVLTGNVAFEPLHPVYIVLPHAAPWGSNE